MNRLMKSTMIAATLVVGMTATYGQDLIVAKVPFEFTSGAKKLPAGTYRIDTMRGNAPTHIIRMTNGKDGVLISAMVAATGNGAASPRLVFACASEACRLTQIWNSDGQGVIVSAPKRSNERAAVVNLAPSASAGQ